MATIEPYETKAGKRWRVRYRKPDRRQTDKRGFKTKRDAQLFAATVEVDKATGTYIDPTAGRVTVGELGELWLKRQTHWKDSHRYAVEAAWRNHVKPEWETRAVSSITRTDVSTWVATLTTAGKSRTVIGRALGILSGTLGDAVDDRLILTNPAEGIRNLPTKPKGEQVFLTHDQLWRFADQCGEYRTLALLMRYTGLRWGGEGHRTASATPEPVAAPPERGGERCRRRWADRDGDAEVARPPGRATPPLPHPAARAGV